jgi:N-acetylglucosamine-6-phosphate deacetylase
MPTNELTARHFATRQPVTVRWSGGAITEITEASGAPENLWVAPAIVDLQVNGYAGVDFQRDGVTRDELLRAVRGLHAAGCARILLTLTTDHWPRMLERLRHFATLRAASPELSAAIAGWHMEGPFLSREPGFCGAHDPACMSDPTPERMRELREAAGDLPVLLTLAPERLGAVAAIVEAAALGIKVSLGHCNPSAEQLRLAVAAGAVAFTHLGNGCPQQLDRHDNILWRVFDTPGLRVGLIPDQVHVSPALFRVLHRQLDAGRIWYTTDAVAPAGAPPGRYTVGRLDVDVGPDQIVRQPGRTNFAGSALRPMQGVMRAARTLKCAWQEVWPRCSTQPCELAGLHAGMAVGEPATFCELKTDAAGTICGGATYVGGVRHELAVG